jgi:hypothetical protein
VSVTRDSAKAASAVIPAGGGTLTATGGDGSVFTLTIPDKALGGDEKITMTPLSAVTGLPFSGGLVAGVQLEPDGLQLFRMATLTIKPARSVPIAKQVAVGYHGSGDNLYMQPLDRVAGISIHLLHFSGAGVASGITGEIEEQAKNPPGDPADQAAQQIAAEANAAIAAEREAALLGKPPKNDVADILKGTLNRWFDQVVEPKVAGAQADYTLTDDAMYNALRWLRMLALLGAEDQHKAQIDRLMAQLDALRKAYEKALTDRCIGKHDLSAILPLIALERQYQLLGVKTSNDPGPFDTIKKCVRFELDFETVTQWGHECCPFVLHDRVTKLVIQPDFPSGNLSASQLHEPLAVQSTNPARSVEKPVSAKAFTVTNLSFHMHFVLKRNAKSAPAISGVALSIDPGEVTVDVWSVPKGDYPDSPVPTLRCETEASADYDQCWGARHRAERVGEMFVIPMDYAGTSLFARKTYDIPCEEKRFFFSCVGNEKTTFSLRHAPLAN